MKRYKIIAPRPRIPSEYQEVEYIESSGTQYIDTGFYPNGNTKFSVQFENLAMSNGTASVLGAWDETTNAFLVTCGSSALYVRCGGSDNFLFAKASGIMRVSCELDTAVVNGSSITQAETSSDTDISSSILVFGRNNEGVPEVLGSNRIWWLKIWNGAEIMRDFIPCYRKADNEVGLYDLITKQFYSSQGADNFIKGKDVLNLTKYDIYAGDRRAIALGD